MHHVGVYLSVHLIENFKFQVELKLKLNVEFKNSNRKKRNKKEKDYLHLGRTPTWLGQLPCSLISSSCNLAHQVFVPLARGGGGVQRTSLCARAVTCFLARVAEMWDPQPRAFSCP
jgi:hypothetical protein